jgi:hypothetical protein
MAIPQDTRFITQVVASTLDEVRPDLVDNLFRSNALFARLYQKGKVVLDGADEIRIPFIYDRLPGDWYTGLGPFAVTQKEIITSLRFNWKSVYTSITLPGLDVFKNSGPYRSFDLVAAQLTTARMTLADKLGTAIFNDGTNAAQLTGLRGAIGTSGTYGGITRDSSVVGTAVQGNVDTTGGAITLPFINSLMGTASRGGAEKPDLLVTTQTLWDAVWARVQPQQRYPNPSQQDIANVGFDVININGAALVADSHCPDGYLFGLNTNYMEFYVGQGYDFYVRGPFPLQVQDGFTAQVLMYCELALQAPGLMFVASSLTA